MHQIYETAIENLLKLVEASADKLTVTHGQYTEAVNPLIVLGDKRLGTYSSIVEANEYRAAKVIERIAVSIFAQMDMPTFEYYPVNSRYAKLPPEEQAKSRPFQTTITENGKKYGVVFSNMCDVGEYAKRFSDGEYSVQAIKLVILAVPDAFAKDALFDKVNEMNAKTGLAIERIPVMDFWRQYFGEEACKELRDFCEEFNTRAAPLMGFNTVIAPTEKALKQFGDKCGKEITQQRDDYKQRTPDTYINGQSQVEKIVYNYFDRGLWRAMVGNSNYAMSFITSEWMYSMYQLTENLDLTSVVTGYLKSIEQLIFAVIDLPREETITIKSKDRDVVEFCRDNMDIIDTTLWSLEQVLRHNSSILDITGYVKRHLVDTIDDWRDKQRNGYFHQHNLHSIDKVEEIREKALYLYFLILGSCTIKDEQFALLGIGE